MLFMVVPTGWSLVKLSKQAAKVILMPILMVTVILGLVMVNKGHINRHCMKFAAEATKKSAQSGTQGS